ncbi:hypothetical protein GLOIN_2v186628 [Rhizophagus irregularis DAOM 181602=DAOM 197198]|uniref:Uncharacterized protein n=1 Tax=Rhizophagus irregularis (strain DAOM 181602 / DAOM 197198 / MUCL 43194) TaxID=747089 RepID=A0A2P4PUZ4_RHIID|nr:hypothetical protein GLOIN_2v186628 [Rhizophagus irregularis DAOM 181602=DAOM 197198]POG69215.1 hypothetical protein GLOIN_2v186628 [Rhizophagus irregularis DAOM 181602=DAOM 197198]|eukprot:XP_025176081.1 hypothetical protein GLOIN_2v186628 [Rhizophagus irregularis DAOM 181602=DAOM 197198]
MFFIFFCFCLFITCNFRSLLTLFLLLFYGFGFHLVTCYFRIFFVSTLFFPFLSFFFVPISSFSFLYTTLRSFHFYSIPTSSFSFLYTTFRYFHFFFPFPLHLFHFFTLPFVPFIFLFPLYYISSPSFFSFFFSFPLVLFRSFHFFHSPFAPFCSSFAPPSFLSFPFTLPIFFIHPHSFFLFHSLILFYLSLRLIFFIIPIKKFKKFTGDLYANYEVRNIEFYLIN